jgi:hypothetical protein
VGQCFHSALLYCALLRNRGLPARARSGFACYFQPGSWIDHWVTERWDGSHWICEDADADRHDLGPDDFRPAGRAWLACRQGEDDPASYGIGVAWGWTELRGSLLSDASALLKHEQFTWDGWDPAQPVADAHPAEEAWLDRLAKLTLNEDLVLELAQLWRDRPSASVCG